MSFVSLCFRSLNPFKSIYALSEVGYSDFINHCQHVLESQSYRHRRSGNTLAALALRRYLVVMKTENQSGAMRNVAFLDQQFESKRDRNARQHVRSIRGFFARCFYAKQTACLFINATGIRLVCFMLNSRDYRVVLDRHPNALSGLTPKRHRRELVK